MEEFIYYDALFLDRPAYHLCACHYAHSVEECKKAIDEAECRKEGQRFTITKTTVHTFHSESGEFLRREEITEAVETY